MIVVTPSYRKSINKKAQITILRRKAMSQAQFDTDLLRNTPIFSSLTDSQLEKILNAPENSHTCVTVIFLEKNPYCQIAQVDETQVSEHFTPRKYLELTKNMCSWV
jgi:hypothetical protein